MRGGFLATGRNGARKSSWRDEYLKWLCGFANAQGGVLEIGRNDTSASRTRAPQVDKTMELLLSKYLKAVISYEGYPPDRELSHAEARVA